MPQVQLFGLAKSQTTRKAQRFFKERRIPFHFVDLQVRAPSPGELRHWVQRFGVQPLLDPGSRSYVEQGLRYVSASDEDWIRRIIADPTVLRLPLARCGTDLAVGDDLKAWQRFADTVKGK
jgi:arsenate reductase (glutaredoxin)